MINKQVKNSMGGIASPLSDVIVESQPKLTLVTILQKSILHTDHAEENLHAAVIWTAWSIQAILKFFLEFYQQIIHNMLARSLQCYLEKGTNIKQR